MRGTRRPLEVDEISRIALVSAALPVVLMLTFCENASVALNNIQADSVVIKQAFIIHINMLINNKALLI